MDHARAVPSRGDAARIVNTILSVRDLGMNCLGEQALLDSCSVDVSADLSTECRRGVTFAHGLGLLLVEKEFRPDFPVEKSERFF